MFDQRQRLALASREVRASEQRQRREPRPQWLGLIADRRCQRPCSRPVIWRYWGVGDSWIGACQIPRRSGKLNNV